ncbi:hypothetical protein HDR58_03980, partial [bacterium]|nr:hypothetical protein [bacterium]
LGVGAVEVYGVSGMTGVVVEGGKIIVTAAGTHLIGEGLEELGMERSTVMLLEIGISVAIYGSLNKIQSAVENSQHVMVEVGSEGGLKSNYKLLNTSSADDVNTIFKETMGYEVPYKPGTTVSEIQLTESTTFVRVYDKTNSRMQGGWVMKAEDVAGLTPQEIQNKFALPTTPKYICDVNLEAGTKLRTGEANRLFGFEGGGQQYDLIINGKNVGVFENERIIGQ